MGCTSRLRAAMIARLLTSEVSMASPVGGVGVLVAGEGARLMDVEGAELVSVEMEIGANSSPRRRVRSR